MEENTGEYAYLILNDDDKVDEVLLTMAKLGIRGATLIDSAGMGAILRVKFPFMSDIKNCVKNKKLDNKTILTVINDDGLLKEAVSLLRTQLNLDKPGTGIMFVVPVTEVYGTAQLMDEE